MKTERISNLSLTTITRFTKEQLIKRLEEQDSAARYALSFVQDSEILRDIEMDLRITEIALVSLDAGSNSHPAHGPLSDYRLHRISDILRKAAAQRDGGNIGYAMSDAVKAIDELLEVRKAEPVADVVAWASPNEERTCDIRWRRFDVAPGPLYTTPQPAPELLAIIERLNLSGYEHENEGVTPKHAAAVVDTLLKQLDDAVQKPAAAVPDEMTPQQASRSYGGEVRGYRDGWNACRAAMLNHSGRVTDMVEHVSQPYKLPPHAYRELVNQLHSTAMKYSGCQQLREQISRTLGTVLGPAHSHIK